MVVQIEFYFLERAYYRTARLDTWKFRCFLCKSPCMVILVRTVICFQAVVFPTVVFCLLALVLSCVTMEYLKLTQESKKKRDKIWLLERACSLTGCPHQLSAQNPVQVCKPTRILYSLCGMNNPQLENIHGCRVKMKFTPIIIKLCDI